MRILPAQKGRLFRAFSGAQTRAESNGEPQ